MSPKSLHEENFLLEMYQSLISRNPVFPNLAKIWLESNFGWVAARYSKCNRSLGFSSICYFTSFKQSTIRNNWFLWWSKFSSFCTDV